MLNSLVSDVACDYAGITDIDLFILSYVRYSSDDPSNRDMLAQLF